MVKELVLKTSGSQGPCGFESHLLRFFIKSKKMINNQLQQDPPEKPKEPPPPEPEKPKPIYRPIREEPNDPNKFDPRIDPPHGPSWQPN